MQDLPRPPTQVEKTKTTLLVPFTVVGRRVSPIKLRYILVFSDAWNTSQVEHTLVWNFECKLFGIALAFVFTEVGGFIYWRWKWRLKPDQTKRGCGVKNHFILVKAVWVNAIFSSKDPTGGLHLLQAKAGLRWVDHNTVICLVKNYYVHYWMFYNLIKEDK